MGRMKKTETPAKLRDEKLFKLIRNYLLVYLPVQREASAHTVTDYRTVLSQYLSFAAEKNGIKLNAVTFDMFNRENVDAYLDYLTAEKGFSTATRNNRLAAIRAFVSYASACYPEYMALESELSAIKVQKDDPFSKVDYMTENAVTALLNEPDAKTKIGLRDRFLMIFLYDSGARISEALGVRLRDVKLGNFPQVLLFGKGNKVRTVPLMEKTVEHLQQYIAVFHKEESLTSAATLFYVLHKGKKEPMNDETVRVNCKNTQTPQGRSVPKSRRKYIRTCGGIQERCIFTSMVWIYPSCPNGSAMQICLHPLFTLMQIRSTSGMPLKKRWVGSIPA